MPEGASRGTCTIPGPPVRRGEAFLEHSLGIGMRPSAGQRTARSDDRECLAPGTRLSPKEGDAFLVRVRVWDIALLMGESLCTNCSFGMRRPYIWVMFSRTCTIQAHSQSRPETQTRSILSRRAAM